MIKLLFGGSFGWVQGLLISAAAIAIMGLWRDYTGAKKDVERLTGEVSTLQGTIRAKDGVIASMGRSDDRRDAADSQSQGLGNDIRQASDGKHCAASEPIIIALDGLRNTLSGATIDNPAENVPMPTGTDTAGD